jgi:hypothetical protein
MNTASTHVCCGAGHGRHGHHGHHGHPASVPTRSTNTRDGASATGATNFAQLAHVPGRRRPKFDPLGSRTRRIHPANHGQSLDRTHCVRAAVDDQEEDFSALPENFCIIESRDSVKSFSDMQNSELEQNIQSRRNKIFLLMEEVRRLRIQQRMRKGASEDEESDESYPSFIPFFPPVNEKTLKLYTNLYALTVAAIITFGGLVAPTLEVKLGIGGKSYAEFINSINLPPQLADVDPIVASFCGGAVGVLTSLLIVEKNNSKLQAKQKCIYCKGSGYLPCGACMGTGVEDGCRCISCSGSGKVMCTACFCTGKQLATEHDPRVDPFSIN